MGIRVSAVLSVLALTLAGCEENSKKSSPPQDAGQPDAEDVPSVHGDADGAAVGDTSPSPDAEDAKQGDVTQEEDAGNAGRNDGDIREDAGDVGGIGSDASEETDSGTPKREGINDHYAPLPFCSGRNIFTIEQNKIVGFCGERPVRIYSAPISEDLSNVVAEPLMDLPQQIGGREVFPTLIRSFAPDKFILPMMNPAQDNAATFLLIDISTRTFVGPQVNAGGIQIGTHPQGDPVPISGLADFALIGGEFWGLLQNQNEDETFRYGFGIALPQTLEGFPDLGTTPNAEGIFDKILSNRKEGIVIEEEAGHHFSFRTTHKRPTNLTPLGGGIILIQTGGTADSPASIDFASTETHQLILDRNISLGQRELLFLPRFAVDVEAMKAYPATTTSLWEVDIREEAPRLQENEMPLAQHLQGDIAAVALRETQIIVGDLSGSILFVEREGPLKGIPTQSINVGGGLTDLALDVSGRLFVAVQNNISRAGPHVVALLPNR